MAGSYTYHSLCHNPPPGGENELARGPSGVPTKNNNILISFLSVFRAQISAPTPALTPAPAPSSIKELCQQLLKIYAAIFPLLKQNYRSGSCKQLFKARFPDFYYNNLYIKYFRFCQLCEYYFRTNGASGPNRILFVASLLRVVVV